MSTVTPSLRQFTQEAEQFVSAHQRAKSASDDVETSFSVLPEKIREVEERELVEAIAWRRTTFDAGFGWIDGPAAFGGRDFPARYADAYRGVERRFHVPDEGYTRFSVGILTPALLEHADDALTAELLRPLRRGDIISCQLFSEPGAGSDMASARTRARREAGEWVVDGQKVWTSGAHYSDVGLLLARTVPGTQRNAGLTAFLIDMDQPGIEVRPIRQMTGGASFSEVFLDGARVPDSRRVGEEGQGWSVIATTMRFERAVIGTDGGVDLDLLGHLAHAAHAAGLADDTAMLDAIGEILVRGRSAAAMTQHFLDASGGAPGPEMSMSKLLLTDNLARISRTAEELLGSRLAVRTDHDFSWNQLALSLEGLRIGGGTDEIMRTIVAERTLGLPRPPKPATRSA
ncbi:acyl-CoA dehydrogenase family protein [Aeromicrobium wangtongii]|uniref:acyl-CoA dehydrogenase family protein n=1 Tax=Aeromicrobium wangtongii TaxID=2969247 RepID=UPI00201719C4|nr:acyl-CoA dehydrogenase family protein [Aeromicrobium wangtongii]MCL3819836.1 acyl-CoA dehydrogenase family protein [Aeromicrobium wangtongii]